MVKIEACAAPTRRRQKVDHVISRGFARNAERRDIGRERNERKRREKAREM